MSGAQLDTLKRGDGLKKDEDQTLLANMYDPDDVKGEKSNKRRQRARERTDGECRTTSGRPRLRSVVCLPNVALL